LHTHAQVLTTTTVTMDTVLEKAHYCTIHLLFDTPGKNVEKTATLYNLAN